MAVLLRLAGALDQLSRWFGVLAGVGLLLMLASGLFNVLGRFADRYWGTSLSSNSWLELQWYLFSLVFLLGGAYVLSLNEHVRVDLFYGRLSARRRAIINLLGTLLFLIPFCVILWRVGWPWFIQSLSSHEGSPDPGGLLRWPVKGLLPLGIALLTLQALAEVIKNLGVLTGQYQFPQHDELEQVKAEVQLPQEDR